ncbi:MAG: hypothetical protein CMC70_09410 [Flavobacteriaceae bacterium]|nr:hypothetical protein [Flavobacteriaceae bacterium]
MASLYKRYFEISPVNNVTEFSSRNGVDIINFIIPSLQDVLLSTNHLHLTGTLQVNTTSTTPLEPAGAEQWGIDNTCGIHGAIDRVEITSRNGNSLIEQRLNYPIIHKMKKATASNKDLIVGAGSNQDVVGKNSVTVRNLLGRATVDKDGVPFSIQLDTGLLKDNMQRLNLGAIGGLEIKIQLSSTENFLFNINNGATAADLLDANALYTLKNVKLFGRYEYVAPNVSNALQSVAFKKVDNVLQVIQSSNDTIAFQPQVSSLDKIFYVFQPNNNSKNNYATNSSQMNNLVGIKNYRESRNGTLFPKDYQVDNEVPVSELNAASSGDTQIQSGNAEQVYHLLVGLNDQYPPIHSLVAPKNEVVANADLSGFYGDGTNTTNRSCSNVEGICCSYQYGFEAYATPMQNDLVQLQAESSVKTSDGVVNSVVRDQVQTCNTLIQYNTNLQYSNLQVAK